MFDLFLRFITRFLLHDIRSTRTVRIKRRFTPFFVPLLFKSVFWRHNVASIASSGFPRRSGCSSPLRRFRRLYPADRTPTAVQPRTVGITLGFEHSFTDSVRSIGRQWWTQREGKKTVILLGAVTWHVGGGFFHEPPPFAGRLFRVVRRAFTATGIITGRRCLFRLFDPRPTLERRAPVQIFASRFNGFRQLT